MLRRRASLAIALALCFCACGVLYDVDDLEEGPSKVGSDSGTCGADDECPPYTICRDDPDAATVDSGVEGGVGRTCVACGDENSPCCTGVKCNRVDLACVGDQCVACGAEGQDCCAGGCDEDLHCNTATNKCSKCAEAGVACSNQPFFICDSQLACVACGGLTTPMACCPGQQCNSELSTCCDNSSTGDTCLACTNMPNCTCKLCCYRCQGWTNPKSLQAPPGQCDAMAKNQCPPGELINSYFKAGACN